MLESWVIQAHPVKDVLRGDVGVVVHLRSVGTRNWRMRSIRCARRGFVRRPHGIVHVERGSAHFGRRCWEAIGLEWRLDAVRGGAPRISALNPTFFFGTCPADLTRFRLLITSVLRLMGLARPWSFRNRPQALHRTEPASSLLHKGVVDVWQFWQTGCV